MSARSFTIALVAGVTLVPITLADGHNLSTIEGVLSFGVPDAWLAVKATRLADGTVSGYFHDGTTAYQVVETAPPSEVVPFWCVHARAVDAAANPWLLMVVADVGDGVTTLDSVGVLSSSYDLPCSYAWVIYPSATPTAGDLRGSIG